MRKTLAVLFIFSLVLVLGPAAHATNGDNLIGVGPISRAMGGAGVAAPQDATSAIFANPAAMCFGPFCPGSSVDFAGTIFVPSVKGATNFGPGMAGNDDSNLPPSVIPAIAVTSPINEKLRFGAGMYGVSGLGVDYENYQYTPCLYAIAGPEISAEPGLFDYSELFGWRFIRSCLAKPRSGTGCFPGVHRGAPTRAPFTTGTSYFGLSVTTPEKVNHKNVADFDGNGTFDDLKLEATVASPGRDLFRTQQPVALRGLYPLSEVGQCRGLRGVRLGGPMGLRPGRPMETGRKVGPAPRLQLRQEPGQGSQRLESRRHSTCTRHQC